MKALITGAFGMLGSDVSRVFSNDYEIAALSRKDLDITNPLQTERIVLELKPDIVINCAAFTKVDECESDAELGYAVNTDGAANIANACEKAGAMLIHISTDYVFDGSKGSPYVETDTPNPLNIYGSTKLAGETRVRENCERHFIVRTQSLFGRMGKNFVKTMLKLAGDNSQITVVDDQYSSPTYTGDLAAALLALSHSGSYGTYHLTNSGICSWYEFACEIFNISGMQVSVAPCKADDFPRPAKRPLYSALKNSRWQDAGNAPLRDWRDALKCYITEGV